MNYTQEEVNLIVADSFRDLSYGQKRAFLAVEKGVAEKQKYEDALIKSCGEGVYNKLREKFYDGSYRDKILSSLTKKKITCITAKSADYPENLNHVHNPPIVLYARGNVGLLKEKIFAVVGSRRSTAQTIEECRSVSEKLSAHFVIATGVADGADSAAAIGALGSGRIICVLPCGHGYSTDTLRKVEDKGLSISEFPPDTRTQQFMFSMRNRILAGLSEGVLVVSAGSRGGGLSTAGFAADYGKDVFAFPHSLGVTSGKGCNELIKSGAYLCDCVEDIFSVMGIKAEKSAGEKAELDGDEMAILSALKQEGEMHAEKLAALTGKKTYELAAICSSLEIKGLIIRIGGNKFAPI